MDKLKKYLSIVTLAVLLFGQAGLVTAFEVPTAPTPPPAPASFIPTAETSPSAPIPPPAPTAPPAPTPEVVISGQNGNQNATDEKTADRPTADGTKGTDTSSSSTNKTSSPPSNTSLGNQTGSQTQNSQVGSTSINTGTATNNAGVITVANSNLSAGVGGGAGSGASVINLGNGSASDNSGSISLVGNNNTSQNNNANVKSSLSQNTVTGQNSASYNTGGSSEITSGNANTAGTIMTAVNTNIDALAVAEFNIADNHLGDFVLDFASGCISGCGGGSLTAANSANGTNSKNSSDLTQVTNNNTFQKNDANVENSLTLAADSGSNTTSSNTNGDSIIDTGNANVSANLLTAANNNILGNVIYTVVNIFGNLIGDIIMPSSYASTLSCSSCGGDLTAANTGNGSGSINNSDITQITNNNTAQFNKANIENNLLLSAATGNNDVSQNTGGDSSITSGKTNIDAQVLNVANSNIDGGGWWLVLVNEAGRWIGKILGSPNGANFAGSAGTQFIVAENGEITAINSGNGSNSSNSSSVTQVNNNTTVQDNNAKIVNNLNLSANTGGNSASSNTGGNTKITTGNANVIANIVNFVNNNITGGGKLYVTVINVFGSWLGDFIGPGQKKEKTLANQGNTGPGPSGPTSQPDHGGNGSSGSSTSAGQATSTANTTIHSAHSVLGLKVTSQAGNSNPTSWQIAGFKENAGNILGQSISQSDQASQNQKVVKINLAWLLLALPSVGVILMARKKLKFLT